MLIGVYTNVQPTTSPGGMLLKLNNHHMVSTASQYATGNQLYNTALSRFLLLLSLFEVVRFQFYNVTWCYLLMWVVREMWGGLGTEGKHMVVVLGRLGRSK